jgi:diguanylate cyclase (GGDEF)-like protein/PAS domain S-box-containing protein
VQRESDVAGVAEELGYYRAFGERMHHAFAVLEPDLTVRWISPNFTTMLGYRLSDLEGRTVFDLVDPEDLDLLLPIAMQVLGSPGEIVERPSAARAVELDVRVRTLAGDWFRASIAGRVLNEDGRLMCSIRPAAEEHALHAVLDHLGSGSSLDDVVGAVVGLLTAQFGCARASIVHDFDGAPTVIGTLPVGADDATALLAELRADAVLSPEIRCGGRWIVPVLSPRRDALHGAFVMDAPRPDPASPYDTFVGHRTAHLAALAFGGAEDRRSLHRAATHDHLTSATSRREFEEQLERVVDRGELPVALLYVDLDGFKAINDELGHHHGDQVLVAVAARLADAVRPSDTVARLGGDEFAVLCRNLRPAHLAATIQRITALLSQPVPLQPGLEVVPGASIGSAVAQHPNQLVGLLQRADADMYRHKRGA